MLGNDYADQTCSVARSLEVVGERWPLLILRDLFLGNDRSTSSSPAWASPARCSPGG